MIQMTASYRSKYPVATTQPTLLGKQLAVRFLSLGANGSPDAELRSYADVVDPYFGERRKPAAAILKDILEYRKKWPIRRYDLTSFEFAKFNDSKTLLSVSYTFRYRVAGVSKERAGVVSQETIFTKLSEDLWVASGVRVLNKKED